MNETAGNKGRTLPPKAVRSAACFPSRDTHIKERSAHCALHLPEAHTEKPERLAVATTFVFVPMEGGDGRSWGGAVAPLVAHAGGEVIRHTKKPLSEVRAAVGGVPRPTQPTRPRPKAAAGSALASGEALVE